MPQRKRDSAVTARAIARPKTQKPDKGEDAKLNGSSSLYQQKKLELGENSDTFYQWLKKNHLQDPSVCLGYHVERVRRERGWSQQDIADNTAGSGAPLTRSLISAILNGRTSVRADTWNRLAAALDANALEFLIAEGWVDPGDIAAFQVSHSHLLQQVARKLDQIEPAVRPTFVALVEAAADTIIAQQNQQKK